MKPQPSFDQQNRNAAAIVLADVERYGGEQAGLVQWARMVLANVKTKGPAWDAPAQRELFTEAAA